MHDDFYTGMAWRRLRERVRGHQPACCACLAQGITTPARMVEHIIPRRVDASLALAYTNMAALCLSCANRKTAYERTQNVDDLDAMVRQIRQGRDRQEEPWSGSNWKPMVG